MISQKIQKSKIFVQPCHVTEDVCEIPRPLKNDKQTHAISTIVNIVFFKCISFYFFNCFLAQFTLVFICIDLSPFEKSYQLSHCKLHNFEKMLQKGTTSYWRSHKYARLYLAYQEFRFTKSQCCENLFISGYQRVKVFLYFL